MSAKRDKWANRVSLYWIAEHALDKQERSDYDYHGFVMKNSVSPILYDNETRKKLLNMYDVLVCYCIDAIKHIKKFRNYAIDKKDKRFN